MRFAVTAILSLLLGAVIIGSCGQDENTPSEPDPDDIPAGFALGLEQVASGLAGPLFLTAPRGDNRLFVVEKPGRIRIVADGQLLATPFLDISSRINAEEEQGLLGLAFHPGFSSNGFFLVNFNDEHGNTRIERFRVSGNNPNVADPSSASPVLQVQQTHFIHKGGMILFAPDGTLIIGMGDGGTGGDESQDKSTLLGDILRLDVDGSPYSVPRNNPFVGEGGVRSEIWATGVRNPWRMSIDPVTNLLYMADVGQSEREELNIIPFTSGGKNFGWPITEGSLCYSDNRCSTSGLTPPVYEYDHDNGCSIIGGYVYRGEAMPEIHGRYFYTDFCGGWLKSLRYTGSSVTEHRNWQIPSLGFVLSMGQDASGELYMLTSSGYAYRIVRAAQNTQ